MKFVLASTYVPFIKGGGRFIVDWLEAKLLEHGHEVETFFLPFTDHPEKLLEQIAAFRLMDLRDALRQAITDLDNATFAEARTIFTNSQRVSDRLTRFNGVASTPLYPPILDPEQFVCGDYGEEIVVLNRVEPHKRQLLMVEAMTKVKTPVRLRLCGRSTWPVYAEMIRAAIADAGLKARVTFEDRWISEADKAAALKDALAIAYAPFDEDGIGYPCEEAAHARKAVIATTDSGAVLEFVSHGRNGLVVEPDAGALAEAMDRLYLDRALARRYGEANFARLGELKIDWSHVVEAIAA
jgi:glycosyltransferase involved in cell wall biosynthesis